MRIGVLTGGGDCPGLNAVLRAIVRSAINDHGDTVVGFLDAWDGVLEKRSIELTVQSLAGVLPRGGTVLGTRRGGPYDYPDGPQQVREVLAEMSIDALVVIGGNGSLTVASRLHDEVGINVIGVPKTIDNDVEGTDVCFGFHTAVQIATDAIDRLHTTAESHDRVMVVEVMGRDTGWIATYAGIAGGATAVLIPERPFDINEVANAVKRKHSRGRYASIVVVAEGAIPKPGTMTAPQYELDPFGRPRLGGISVEVARELFEQTGFETRVVQIGHVQRGGTPNAFDRVLCTRLGVAVVTGLHDGVRNSMVAVRGEDIVTVPLSDVVGRTRYVDLSIFDDVATVFFG
jgi:ATP-dependent phosphofructokinase / diphosphate-dependent phosphofructokinase